MNYQFGFVSKPPETLVQKVDALGLANEAWYIPPTVAPERGDNFGDYRYALELIKSLRFDCGLRHWADLTGTFIVGDFIEAMFTHFNLHTEVLYIDHYNLSENNIDSLVLLLDKGYVDRIEMMISDYWFRTEIHDLVPYAYDKLGKTGRFQLGVNRTHKKLVCFMTDKGAHVVIHGSANLRSSDADEHLMIEDNEELYKRVVPRIQAKIARYKTINETVLAKTVGIQGKDLINQLRQTRCLTRSESWQVDQDHTKV
jgi:hypothetical protein